VPKSRLEEFRAAVDKYGSQRAAAKALGVHHQSLQRSLKRAEKAEPVLSGTKTDMFKQIPKRSGSDFIFMAVQNETQIHPEMWATLKQATKYFDAELVVSRFLYDRKNAHWKDKQGIDRYWFDPQIKNYVCDDLQQLAPDLYWCGNFNILPTAVDPTSGLDSYAGSASLIIPHAKLQLRACATPPGIDAKHIYTTGALSQRNYIQAKAGQRAEWDHVFSALYVHVDSDGKWFTRQLCADSETGHIQDLDVIFTPSGWTTGNRIGALTPGDLHFDNVSHPVLRGIHDMIDTLRPEYLFGHDSYDQRRRNHHNMNDPHYLYRMFARGTESVADEVRLTYQGLAGFARDFCKVVAVESNHDLALTRWLKEQDYRRDPVNALFFLQLQTEVYKAIRDGENMSVLGRAMELLGLDTSHMQFLRGDESFTRFGIRHDNHGDRGPNGSRGNIKNIARTGVRHNIGHSHQAGVFNGVFMAGKSQEKAGYEKGPSAHSNSHIITYPTGKRCIVTSRGEQWR